MSKKEENRLLNTIVKMPEEEIERLKKAEAAAGGPWFYRGGDQTPFAMVNVLGDTSWAKAPAETIQEMLAQHYAGKISIYNFWGIGDEREIKLGGKIDKTIQMVLTDKEFYRLYSGEKADDPLCAFTVDQKNVLLDNDRSMNEKCTNEGGWRECDLRKWLNTAYSNALPGEYENIFKCFTVCEGLVDRFCLRSEVELFGEAVYGSDKTGRQIEWYKQTRNRIKLDGDDYGEARWYWERSPYSGYSNSFCFVTSGGSANGSTASLTLGIAPFGCI